MTNTFRMNGNTHKDHREYYLLILVVLATARLASVNGSNSRINKLADSSSS